MGIHIPPNSINPLYSQSLGELSQLMTFYFFILLALFSLKFDKWPTFSLMLTDDRSYI